MQTRNRSKLAAVSNPKSPSNSAAFTSLNQPLVEISEEEQWRLINQSGILDKNSNIEEVTEEGATPLADDIFNAILYIIPFSFLLLMMEVLIHQQYRQRASMGDIVDRMVPGVPILSVFIFYTMRHKQHRQMQIFLFILSALSSSRMIYLINVAPWLVNMRQGPPLATLWIYTIVQLELGPAVLSLLTTGSYVWWKGLKIVL